MANRSGEHSAQRGVVSIIQPYVPRYRVPLFNALATLLDGVGLALHVAHPELTGDQALRNDASGGSWAVPLRSRLIDVFGHELRFRNSMSLAAGSDVIVAELASTNLDTYSLAARHARKLILWGHGKNYVGKANRVDDYLEQRLARRAAHLMVYTEGGRQNLENAGLPAEKITVVRNSTDTQTLRDEKANLDETAVARFRERTRAVSGHTAVFVGALDPSKNLPLLFQASALIQQQLPDFRLIVAGDGPLRGYVRSVAANQREITVLPYADQSTLALLGQVSDLCLMPGRVGLVAVDAMALGLPVVTTNWPYHAPEREYLTSGHSWTTDQHPVAFASQVLDVLSKPDVLRAASMNARLASRSLSIDAMAENMFAAITGVSRQS